MDGTFPLPFNFSSTILDNLPLLVWAKDIQGRYLYANHSFCNYAKHSKEDILGKTDYDIFSLKEADIYVSSDSAVLAGGSQRFFESHINGNWKEEYKQILLDDFQQPMGTFGYARDITTRKETAEALARSERSKAILISNLPGAAFRQYNDENWTMTFLSEGAYELTGYRPEELVGNPDLTYNDLICPEFREKLLPKWEDDVARGEKASDEYPIITKSGELKWVWEQSVPVKDETGEYTESEGFILDISDIKNALQALNESEERFRTIFQEAPIGIAIFGADQKNPYQVNKKFAEILGRTPEELCSTGWRAYSHPDDIPESLHWIKLLNERKINGFQRKKRCLRPDGSLVWVNMTVVVFSTENSEKQHLCMIEDITQTKLREDAIHFLSYHDALTGLNNRAYFEEQRKILDAKRKVPVSVIMGDLNGLKLVNDSFGHAAGDQLLKETASILQQYCGAEGIAARLGGDEVALLLPKTSRAEAALICENIYRTFEEYNKNPEREAIYLSISLGYATKTDQKRSIEALMTEAEQMYYDKKNERRLAVQGQILRAARDEFSRKFPAHAGTHPRKDQLLRLLAAKLNLSQAKIRILSQLSELHDIGQLSLPREVCEKNPEDMTKAEFLEYKKHCEAGHRIAMGIPELKNLAEAILYHHENWDGSGFPENLRFEEIPLFSRIIHLVDSYCRKEQDEARGRTPHGGAIRYVLKRSGTEFDPALVEAFSSLSLPEESSL